MQLIVSAVIIAAVVFWGLISPATLSGFFNTLLADVTRTFGWFYLWVVLGLVGLAFFLAVSRYGDLKLGDEDDDPEFSVGAWFAMLFAAGMVLFDSLDGILMSRAYSWAFLKPIRKIYYNFTVTVLSVTVALSIGLLLLVQLASEWVPALAWAGRLDLEYVGFGLVALFVLVWIASVAWFHLARVEEKFEKGIA